MIIPAVSPSLFLKVSIVPLTPCVRIVVASNFQLEEARNEKKFHNII